jgi:hypothetical protein
MDTDVKYPRPWYAVRPMVVIELVAVGMIALAALATLIVRERIAAIPEIGHATPIEELRAAWAEADREADGPFSPQKPVTMPHPRRSLP